MTASETQAAVPAPKSGTRGSRAIRLRGVSWFGLLLCAAVVLGLGWKTTPAVGESDDRVYSVGSQMKCLQCAGESVAGSQAKIAVQMRTEMRKQMRAGRTDDEILTYFSQRYGQEVLHNPAGSGVAGLIWVIPVVFVAVGACGVALIFNRSRQQRRALAGEELSEEQRARVAQARASYAAGATDTGGPRSGGRGGAP